MLLIEYPQFSPKLRKERGQNYIFDTCRLKWVLLTPEEWVRQSFIEYLCIVKNIPRKLVAVEKELKVKDVKKRFDILVYDANTNPYILVECKEEKVPLNEAVAQQILSYQSVVQAKYFIVTNGAITFGFEVKDGNVLKLEQIPNWNDA